MLEKWQLLESRLVLDNKWCKVQQDTLLLPKGTKIDDYFVNLRPDIALVLPITPENEIVFVRQYRHGVKEILLELPAGSFDPNQEEALIAAQRELEEETGYISSEWKPLAIVYDNPVKDSNRIHIFLALNALKTGKQDFDITEEIEVVLVPLNEVRTQIQQGEIAVAGTLVALYLGLDEHLHFLKK